MAGFSIDLENRIVRNICLLGSKSRNGYEYKTDVMQESAAKYAGRVVYIDHSPTPSKRSLRDKAGRIMASPRFESGRLFGDIKASKGPAGDLFLAEAQEQLDNPDAKDVGMSHVVEGRMSKNGKFVESIEKVISVDVVFNPATMTKGFAESENDTLEQLKPLLETKGQALDTIKAICEAAGVEYQAERYQLPEVPVLTVETVNDLRELAKSKPDLKTFIETHDKLQKNAWVAEVLAEHKLPESAKPALLRCENKELMLENGKVLRETIDALKPAPTQKGREPAKTGGPSMDEIVGAIKG